MSEASSEFDLIRSISRQVLDNPRVPLGIGDDAAAVNTAPVTLVAADTLLEGRHFTIPEATPSLIGRKALAVNLSDFAAMAGTPLAAIVTVAHRRELGIEFAKELHDGLANLAAEFSVTIAGGDTNIWDGPLVVGVTLLGDRSGNRPVTRDGALPNDVVFVTGPLGGSLSSGRHLTFAPRVDEAAKLHARCDLHAMIDISDGLLADLGHICEASGVGCVLNASKIPIHPDVDATAEPRARLTSALSDGEDFELAFCVSRSDAESLRCAPIPGLTLYEVGQIVSGDHVGVLDNGGTKIPIPTAGWRHQW